MKIKCADCGVELNTAQGFEEGDVCPACFQAFDGMLVEDIVDKEPTPSEGETMCRYAYQEVAAREVAWYRRHGLYPERITKDRDGVEYVIGDWSWHRLHSRAIEYVDARMKEEGGQPEGLAPFSASPKRAGR